MRKHGLSSVSTLGQHAGILGSVDKPFRGLIYQSQQNPNRPHMKTLARCKPQALLVFPTCWDLKPVTFGRVERLRRLLKRCRRRLRRCRLV